MVWTNAGSLHTILQALSLSNPVSAALFGASLLLTGLGFMGVLAVIRYPDPPEESWPRVTRPVKPKKNSVRVPKRSDRISSR